MSNYQSETIAGVVRKLNETHFLPAIQREYVWGPEKVIRLFDSLMRGYPISSFLFWELDKANKDKWQVYQFVTEAWSGGTENELAETDGVNQLTLVLDGQQRLTSLLIGLKGVYQIKKKYKKSKFAQNWSKQRLYLDLLKEPKIEDDDIEEGIRYGFEFREDPPTNDSKHHWMKVGRILEFGNDEDFDKFKFDEEENELAESVTKEQIKFFRSNLDRLRRAIWIDHPIAYHTETDQDYDRVLDIFVRANDGGVKLSKSDLLLSMVTAKWGDMNAREEINGFVKHLNDDLDKKNELDKDFIMKACLVVAGLSVKYNVKNFNNQNLDLIKSKWQLIKTASEKAVRLINSFGIHRETLIGANALIPIIYYLFHNPKLTLGGTSPFDYENTAAIRKWITVALLRNVFSGQSDTALQIARTTLETLKKNENFPLDKLNSEMSKAGRSSAFDDDAVEEILSLTYGKPRTFLALTLLYDDAAWSLDPHEDHIFPQDLFTKKSMTQRGYSDARQAQYIELRDRIGNLELLIGKENSEKKNKDFSKWIETRDASFKARHLIPDKLKKDKNPKSLLHFDRFEEFVAQREALIRERLLSLFPKKESAPAS